MNEQDSCSRCGGPCPFDTSLPSVLWNGVIRAQGLPDYLCTTCIVRAFAKAGVSFTATLWGDDFGGLPIEVRVNDAVARSADLLQEDIVALRRVMEEMAEHFERTSHGANGYAVTLRKALAAQFGNARQAERSGAGVG
jgi:hypothetical protein